MRLVCGQHGLASNVCRFGIARNNGRNIVINSSVCSLCDENVVETVQHFLFGCSCNRLSVTRASMLTKIFNAMPSAMHSYVVSLNDSAKTAFILSGLGADFTPGWLTIYVEIANFVHKMYAERGDILSLRN